jgi:hypothetical protein
VILRAQAEGRIDGTFRDRFVSAADAADWLRSAGRVLRRGGEGVEIPGGSGVVRIPQEAVGSGGSSGVLLDIERPSVKERSPGWPSLSTESALLAFRPDGAVYVIAEPADPEAWTECHVFDTATGYHVHTLYRDEQR